MTTPLPTSAIGSDLGEAFHGEFVPKFLATRDGAGKPNVVPVITLDAVDERTLVFAELFIWKTRTNLETDPRVAVAVLTEDLRVWTVRGRFRGFVKDGPYVEGMNAKEMFRYNAYVRVSRAGVIDVETVTAEWRLSKPRIAADLLPVKLVSLLTDRRGERTLPHRVAEKFARTQAVKVLAFTGPDGYPDVVPAFSLVPTGSDTMRFGVRRPQRALRSLPSGTPMAASVITMDPVAYQVKGIFTGATLTPAGWVGRLRVDEVYSASPPLAGERIELVSRLA